MAYALTGFTIATNGQTLTVAITGPFGTSATIYSDAALTSTVTLPQTITSDTTYYVSPNYYGRYTVSVKQPDGSELWGTKVDCFAGDGFRTISPLPSAAQIGADLTAVPATGRLSTGYYHCASSTSTGTNNALGNGTLRVAPFYIPNQITISEIGAEVTSAGEAGSKYRIGVYSSDSSGLPSALVLDAGQINGDSGTVQKVTGLTTTLGPGLYWFGGAVQSAASSQPTMRTAGTQGLTVPIRNATEPASAAAYYGYVNNSVTAELPSTFTVSASSGSAPARIWIRVS